MSARANARAVLAVWAVWLGGCISQPAARPEPPRVVTADGGQVMITAAELDELTRAFADRYVGLLCSACDTVKENNPDPVQRREAQVLLADGASNIYDIASNADAFTRLLDLVVVTRLMSQVWVDDRRAEEVFGDRAPPVANAILHAGAEARALAARVLTTGQLATLDSLLVDWRRENPETIRASFVRFSNFAAGRGRSAASEVLAAGGLFAQVGKAGQAVDEVRLLGERMFYQLKREPAVLRWHAAAVKDDLFATPEVASALADIHRLREEVEQMPARIAAEREAILAAVDARMASADGALVRVKEVIAEARSLMASLEAASKSLDQTLKTGDTLFARYDAWDRWTFEHDPKPFNIGEYTEMMTETGIAAGRLDEAAKSSGDLLGSSDWGARIDEWNRSADGRIEVMAGQSRRLIEDFFRRAYLAIGVLFVLIVGYRVTLIIVLRTLAARRPGAPLSDRARERAD